jgi:flagellar hook protein FlgE
MAGLSVSKSVADATASYTRNGQFHLDAQGYIVNSQLNNLTGYPITLRSQSCCFGARTLDTTGLYLVALGLPRFSRGSLLR